MVALFYYEIKKYISLAIKVISHTIRSVYIYIYGNFPDSISKKNPDMCMGGEIHKSHPTVQKRVGRILAVE